jgi:hypothetical protein
VVFQGVAADHHVGQRGHAVVAPVFDAQRVGLGVGRGIGKAQCAK